MNPKHNRLVLEDGAGAIVLTGTVVQPAYGPAASGPASSWMEMRGVMFRALSRVNPLFITYHSHTTDGRGPGGNRPRLEQPQLASYDSSSSISLYSFSHGLP